MKRDALLLSVCLGLVAGIVLLAIPRAVPASGQAGGQKMPTLILDAGHGGEDGGAVSAGGAAESQINLELVLRMEPLLVLLGIRPQLTRREDISLHEAGCETLREKKRSDLEARVRQINETPNAMLLSIHQNYFTDSRYSGAQVFYHQGDVSRQWGESTQRALRQVLDPDNDRNAMLLNREVYLFEHIGCPAILVECGFLSNGEEASLLVTDSYQKKIAVALAGACLQELRLLNVSEVN